VPHVIEDYHDKTNKQLLIELVIQGNSTVQQGKEIVDHLARLNGSVDRNKGRIGELETKMNERTAPAWMTSRKKVAGYSTLAISIASAVAVGVAEFIKCYVGG